MMAATGAMKPHSTVAILLEMDSNVFKRESRAERKMGTITIGNRSFETPVLVPSVSSFETQLPPVDALRLQFALREPISLVSAYDVWLNRVELVALCKEFRKHGILLLDSGGYESSRISHYAREQTKERWNFSKYAQIAGEEIYAFIFSFDYFPEHHEPSRTFFERILHEFRKHSEVLDITKLIPVVHVRSIDGNYRLSEQEIAELFGALVAKIDCRFIAVPERELGFGITARANLTRHIAAAIRKNSEECSLHILGCGNLLSFSLLAVAGATMFDGLEWCRTLAADNFHLHHFQQRDLFVDPGHHIGNPIAEFMITDAHLDYPATVAVRNLLSFQAFTRRLHSQLRQRSVQEFVRENFGDTAGDAVGALEG
jgi:queuine/archaeosine tRNA-ribosyltransferase